MRIPDCGWLLPAALCVACGGGTGFAADSGDADAFEPSDAGALEPGDAGAFEPGDASWPASPCGQPVRRYTLDVAPAEVRTQFDALLVPSVERGDGERLALARYDPPTGTLWTKSFDLADGSASEARAELPDVAAVDWNLWAVASWARPVVLVASLPPAQRLLWVEANEGMLEVTELAVPPELRWGDGTPQFVPTEDGFLGRNDSAAGTAYLVRVTQDGIVVSPIELPPGSSRYELAGNVDSPYAVIVASRFDDTPRVELARVGPSGSPPLAAWREVFEGEPVLRLDVTPRRVAVTATHDREVEVVWLDSSLGETGRQHVTLPFPAVAVAVGEERHALFAWGDAWGLAYAPLDDGGAGSWHTLLAEPPLATSAWSAGRGYATLSPGPLTAQAFVLCGDRP